MREIKARAERAEIMQASLICKFITTSLMSPLSLRFPQQGKSNTVNVKQRKGQNKLENRIYFFK